MIDWENLGVRELFELRAKVERELARRGISSSIGDIGERLALEHFASRSDLPALAPAPRGTKNIDAISRQGDRYSIKTLFKARKTGTIYPEQDGNDHPMFEYILIVLLDEDCQLQKLYRLSWTQFLALRSWDSRMKAWYVARSERVFKVAEELTSLV